jgi:hypothetical protein
MELGDRTISRTPFITSMNIFDAMGVGLSSLGKFMPGGGCIDGRHPTRSYEESRNCIIEHTAIMVSHFRALCVRLENDGGQVKSSRV